MALTNTQMQAVISGGGSVVYHGTVLTNVSQIPSQDSLDADAGFAVDTIGLGTTVSIPSSACQVLDDTLTVNGELDVDGHLVVNWF